MEDINVVVTSSGLIEEALSDKYLEKLNEEAKTRINKIIHTYLNIS